MTERRSTHLPNMLTGFDVELAIERETDNWGVASVRRSEQCLTLVLFHITISSNHKNLRTCVTNLPTLSFSPDYSS